MKKIKSLAALLIALCMLAPTVAFAACSPESDGDISSDSSYESPADSSADSSGGADSSAGSGNTGGSTGSSSSGNAGGSTGTTAPVIKTLDYIRSTATSVNLRSGAGTGYAVLGTAEKNTRYVLAGTSGEWYKTYYRGKTAYIHASYAAIFSLEKSSDERVEKVLNEGYKLIGVPYVYGAVRYHDGNGKLLAGFSEQKFDCSSLVQYVFYKGAGVKLDLNTRTQVKQGKYVAPSDLRRGDCIYFTNQDRQHLSGIERVGHVAIYLGNNYILHTSSDYARIETMTTARWNYYIEARRFL